MATRRNGEHMAFARSGIFLKGVIDPWVDGHIHYTHTRFRDACGWPGLFAHTLTLSHTHHCLSWALILLTYEVGRVVAGSCKAVAPNAFLWSDYLVRNNNMELFESFYGLP